MTKGIINLQDCCKNKVKIEVITEMKKSLSTIDFGDVTIGPKTMEEVFDLNSSHEFQHTIFNSIITSKINRDYNTIKDGLELLNFYISNNPNFLEFNDTIKQLHSLINNDIKKEKETSLEDFYLILDELHTQSMRNVEELQFKVHVINKVCYYNKLKFVVKNKLVDGEYNLIKKDNNIFYLKYDKVRMIKILEPKQCFKEDVLFYKQYSTYTELKKSKVTITKEVLKNLPNIEISPRINLSDVIIDKKCFGQEKDGKLSFVYNQNLSIKRLITIEDFKNDSEIFTTNKGIIFSKSYLREINEILAYIIIFKPTIENFIDYKIKKGNKLGMIKNGLLHIEGIVCNFILDQNIKKLNNGTRVFKKVGNNYVVEYGEDYVGVKFLEEYIPKE